MSALPTNPFNPALGTGGPFANAGIPILDDGVIPVSANNYSYLKVIDLIFIGAGVWAIWYGHSKKSTVWQVLGVASILAGILGVYLGWD